jgi:trimeric autotransporter adhesin
MTIQTAAPAAVAARNKRWPFLPPGVAIALVTPLFWRRLRRNSQRSVHRLFVGAIVFAMLGAGAAFMTGCGGGFPLKSSSTTYTITVTGTSGSDTHSTTVSLILK